MYTTLFLYEIIKWHHTLRKSLYKEGKLGRTVIYNLVQQLVDLCIVY